MKRAMSLAQYAVSIAVLIVACAITCHGGERQDITAESIIRQTNGERAERHIPVLEGDSRLNRVAQKRLEDMLEKDYFGHTSPSGEDVTDIAGSVNYDYSRIGENLARGNFKNVADLVTFWMKSPQHRKNLLSRDYKEMGVAVACKRMDGRDFWLAVQVFGKTSRPDARPQ